MASEHIRISATAELAVIQAATGTFSKELIVVMDGLALAVA